jgi:hypothetical protein
VARIAIEGQVEARDAAYSRLQFKNLIKQIESRINAYKKIQDDERYRLNIEKFVDALTHRNLEFARLHKRGLVPWTVAVVDLGIVSLPDLQDARALFSWPPSCPQASGAHRSDSLCAPQIAP